MRIPTTMTGWALLVGMLAVPPTAAAERTRTKARTPATVLKTIQVDSTYTEPAPSLDGVDCRFSAIAQQQYDRACRGHFVGPATFKGTFEMDAVFDLLGWADGNGDLRYEGFNIMKGTIPGCGTGTFVLDEPYGVIHRETFDPANQSMRGYNTWFVRKGSGTEGLSNLVSGQGENNWTAFFSRGHDGEDGFGEGRFTGEVTCRVPAERGDRAGQDGKKKKKKKKRRTS